MTAFYTNKFHFPQRLIPIAVILAGETADRDRGGFLYWALVLDIVTHELNVWRSAERMSWFGETGRGALVAIAFAITRTPRSN